MSEQVIHLDGNGKIAPAVEFQGSEKILEYLYTKDAKQATISGNRAALRNYVGFLIGKGINGLTACNIQTALQYKKYLMEWNRAINTQNQYILAVKNFYSWYSRHGGENIFADISVIGQEKYTREAISIEDARKTMDLISRHDFFGKRDYALLALLICSGVRQMSAETFRWADIKAVTDKVSTNMYGNFRLKGKHERHLDVILSQRAVLALLDLKAFLEHRYQEKFNENWYVFARFGEKPGNSSIRKWVTDRMVAANVYVKGSVTPHSWRHGNAEFLLETLPIDQVRRHLGHIRSETTEFYVHRKAKKQTDAAALKQLDMI